MEMLRTWETGLFSYWSRAGPFWRPTSFELHPRFGDYLYFCFGKKVNILALV